MAFDSEYLGIPFYCQVPGFEMGCQKHGYGNLWDINQLHMGISWGHIGIYTNNMIWICPKFMIYTQGVTFVVGKIDLLQPRCTEHVAGIGQTCRGDHVLTG